MKLAIKKIYCPNCARLVNGREQQTNGSAKILCSRCGKTIWVKEGLKWRYVRADSEAG